MFQATRNQALNWRTIGEHLEKSRLAINVFRTSLLSSILKDSSESDELL